MCIIKKLILSTVICLLSLLSYSQINQWTWISGSNLVNQSGVYGTKGTPAAGNIPGGRVSSVSWKDASSNLWLFGGIGTGLIGTPSYLNDLWKFNTTTQQWTWMSGDLSTKIYGVYGIKGTAAATNKPGSRQIAVSWSDLSGNLWLWGGDGYAATSIGYINDLWKYNIVTGLWTWINGDSAKNIAGIYGIKGTPAAANKPGARTSGVSWTDNMGNLWLFGGYDILAERYNDLWKYNPTTNQWAWISGNNTTNASGIYGIKGTASAANSPGARSNSTSWLDASGNLWLFGGYGQATTLAQGRLNDVWKYNIASNQWTWISGDSSLNVKGIYGTKGSQASTNKPGARDKGLSWTDALDNVWLYAGLGYAAPSFGIGELSDVWKYNAGVNEWTWMSGDSTITGAAVYGVKGTADPANKPGTRSSSVSWNSSGNLWLFGGGNSGNKNDLWKYTLNCAEFITPVVTASGPTTFCSADGLTLTSSKQTGNQWYNNAVLLPGAVNQTYNPVASGNYTVIAIAGDCTSSSSSPISITVNTTPATPTISASGPTTFNEGGSVLLNSSAVSGNQWYLNGNAIIGATNQSLLVTQAGNYSIYVSTATCTSSVSANAKVTIILDVYGPKETWSKKTSLLDDIPVRDLSSMVSYNNKLYFFGGNFRMQSNSLKDFWEYNIQNRQIKRLPDLPGGVVGGLAVVANNKLYFTFNANWYEYNFATQTFVTKSNLGMIGTAHGRFVINDTIFVVGIANDLYSYNVITNAWTRRADHPGPARSNSFSFSINGKGYFGGGLLVNTMFKDFYEYDPVTNAWTTKALIPVYVANGVSSSANGKGYIGTGNVSATGLFNNAGYPSTVWYEYDPLINVWAVKSPATDGVINSTSAAVGSDVFIFSGLKQAMNIAYNTSFISRYNTLNNTWSQDTLYAGGSRQSVNSIFYNGKIYLTGGDDGEPRKEVRVYDIASDSWARLKDMPGTGYSQKAQAIINNKLYTVGGSSNIFSSTSGTNELLEYNPAADIWTTKTVFPGGIYAQMAAFSINGFMYAGLGQNGTGAANSPAFYKYNPLTNGWTAVANCPAAGKVSTSFAIDDTGYVIFQDASMFAYLAGTNTWVAKAQFPSQSGANVTSMQRGFSLNGKGYFIGADVLFNTYTELLEYDPAINSWAYKTSWPGFHTAATATVAGNNVFIGMGFDSYHTTNQMWKLNFAPPISDSIGDQTKNLFFRTNQSQSLFDSIGSLLGSVNSKGSSNISITSRRINPIIAFREKFAWFGNNKKENGMFMNRNITVSGASDSVVSRIYFFNYEVDSMLNKFNRNYNTSYTVNNVKAIQFTANTDLDPLNNYTNDMANVSAPKMISTTTGTYGNGRYFEFKTLLGGELYLALTYLKPSPTTITWTGLGSDSTFYNGYNWLPVKIPEFTDTVVFNSNATLKFIPGFGNMKVGDTTGTYANPNVREVIINSNLTLSDPSLFVKAYGISGKLIINSTGNLKTDGDVFADNKNSSLAASLSILNSGIIEAPFLRSSFGWLRLQNGTYKNGYLYNQGKIEIENSLLQNVSTFNLLAGSTTILDTLKLNNTNTDFIFAGSLVSHTWPLFVDLKAVDSKLTIQLPGKPILNGKININNSDANKGLSFSLADTLTSNCLITYANKGGLDMNNVLILNGDLIHNGIGDNSLNQSAVSDVIVDGITQFKAYNLYHPVIISGTGNNQVQWPAGLKIPALIINKGLIGDAINFYCPLVIGAGSSAVKNGQLIIKPWPGGLKTFVINNGSFIIETTGKFTIEK